MEQDTFKFCFTLDTEPDNLWEFSAENTFDHMPRMGDFERRMRGAGSIQTYLTTSEVAESPEGHAAIGEIAEAGSAEIGVHYHTWTREWPFEVPELRDPPVFAMVHQLPADVERQMVQYTVDVLKDKFGVVPTSYRGGRWSIGENTPDALSAAGIRVDSTVLPGINWSDASHPLLNGPDFTQASRYPRYLGTGNGDEKLIQVPVGAATLKVGLQNLLREDSLPYRVVGRIARDLGFQSGRRTLRPATTSYDDMAAVLKKLKSDKVPVWVFMIHSSEVMPCRPLPNESAVSEFLDRCQKIVELAQELGATPATLTDAADWLHQTNRISAD